MYWNQRQKLSETRLELNQKHSALDGLTKVISTPRVFHCADPAGNTAIVSSTAVVTARAPPTSKESV